MILGGATDFRYPENYRDPYGFDGIAIALIGAGHPLGVGQQALDVAGKAGIDPGSGYSATAALAPSAASRARRRRH